MSILSLLFGGGPKETSGQKLTEQLTQEQADRARQAYGLLQQFLPGLASQYGESLSFGSPGTPGTPAQSNYQLQYTGASGFRAVPGATTPGTPGTAAVPPSFSMDPNYNPLSNPYYTTALAQLQSQQSAANKPLLAQYAAQSGQGMSQKGASALNLERQNAQSTQQFGRQFATDQLGKRDAFNQQLMGVLTGQQTLPIDAANTLGSTQAKAQSDQQASQAQLLGVLGYIYGNGGF